MILMHYVTILRDGCVIAMLMIDVIFLDILCV